MLIKIVEIAGNRKVTIPANVRNGYNGINVDTLRFKPVGYCSISAIIANIVIFSKTLFPRACREYIGNWHSFFIQESREQGLDKDDKQDGDVYAGSNDNGEDVGVEMTGVDMTTGTDILNHQRCAVDESEDWWMKLA